MEVLVGAAGGSGKWWVTAKALMHRAAFDCILHWRRNHGWSKAYVMLQCLHLCRTGLAVDRRFTRAWFSDITECACKAEQEE